MGKKRNVSTRYTMNFSRVYKNVLGAFIVICVITSLLCYGYYTSLLTTIREEGRTYLNEISSRIATDVERILSDNVAVLNTMAASIEESDKTEVGDINALLSKQKSHFNYEEIFLVAADGKAYGVTDGFVFLNLDDAVRSDILNGKPSMSTTQIINNKEYILFSVPVQNFVLDGKNIVSLIGCYNAASFNKVLSMTSFNEMSYSQIVSRAGTAVTRPNSQYAISSGYSILATLKDATMEHGFTIEKLQQDMSENKYNQVVFNLDNVQRYLVYTPIKQNDWYLFTFVPTEVVNNKSETLLQTTLLICGLLTFAFSAMVSTLVYIFNKHRSRLETMAYVDPVTGGFTMQRFYLYAEANLTKNPDKQFALIYTNIEKFKVMNEQMGRKNCDGVLIFLNALFTNVLGENELVSRFFADNFCMLIEYTDEAELPMRFIQWYSAAERFANEKKILWSLPTLQMGVYVIQDRNMPFEQMIDRAKLALRETSWIIDNKLRYGYYDDETRRALVREKQLEDCMATALESNEFEVYLQPKYLLPSEKIGGAEALVRWEMADEGMIYPNEFIPLFEKNGFIVQLDLWVFEEVCRCIKSWQDTGRNAIKISVNCSRFHLRDADFLSAYVNIAEKYKIDKSLLEIELTESMVMENSEKLTKIINDIKAVGFGCSMDDFGSGYSSLNMLQIVPVDTLKLDRIFFSKNYEPKRTEALIKSIVTMAESLNMDTVAEGIEIREQVEMLKRTGCHYIQGYVFAKPMPIVDFEKIAFSQE